MLQKMLGIGFFATVLVLSYVATLHIVTTRVETMHHHLASEERLRHVQLGGPVSLRPMTEARRPRKKYPVHKISTGHKQKRELASPTKPVKKHRKKHSH